MLPVPLLHGIHILVGVDAREITAQLQADPALAAVLRGVLLSEEVLHLPAAIAELAQRQARTEERLAELVERVGELAARMAELAERQARTEERLDRVIDDLGRVKGMGLEAHIREQPRRYLRHLVAGARPLDDAALGALEHDLLVRGVTPAVVDDLMRADVIARGHSLDHLDDDLGLVIEASWRLDPRHVELAGRRAAAMARGGHPVLAAIVGREPPSATVLGQARASGVAVVADQEVVEAGHPVA